MGYEQRSGDIAVFRETDKKNEKAPDWKGTMIVPDDAKPGDKLEVAFWAKGDKGTMLAGSVKPAFQKGGGGGNDGFSGQAGRSSRQDPAFDDSDIPFLRW